MARKSAQGSGTIRKKTVTKNGKEYTYWEARYTEGYDPGTGKQIQRSITGKTQREVSQKLKAATSSIDNGTYKAPNKITVSEWLNEWLETYCNNKLKPLTLASYQGIINNHIIPAFGVQPLQTITGTHIQRLYNSMIDKGLSGKTVKNVSAVLHKAFTIALKQGIILANPCDCTELRSQ